MEQPRFEAAGATAALPQPDTSNYEALGSDTRAGADAGPTPRGLTHLLFAEMRERSDLSRDTCRRMKARPLIGVRRPRRGFEGARRDDDVAFFLDDPSAPSRWPSWRRSRLREVDLGSARLKDSARQQAATGPRLATNQWESGWDIAALLPCALAASASVGAGVAQAAAPGVLTSSRAPLVRALG